MDSLCRTLYYMNTYLNRYYTRYSTYELRYAISNFFKTQNDIPQKVALVPPRRGRKNGAQADLRSWMLFALISTSNSKVKMGIQKHTGAVYCSMTNHTIGGIKMCTKKFLKGMLRRKCQRANRNTLPFQMLPGSKHP